MSESQPWRWKSIPVSTPTASGPSHLRTVLELAIPTAVAALLFYFEKPIMAGVILAIGGSIFVAQRASASAKAALDRFFARLAFWIGELLTIVVLVPVYYGIITPVAFILRLRGEDPLDMAIERSRPSYWVDASFPREKRRYFNQFTYERYADPPRGRGNPAIGMITAVLWLLLFNTALGFTLGKLGVGDESRLDFRAASAVYADERDWAKRYFRELARAGMEYRPYLGWSREEFEAAADVDEDGTVERLINVDERGIRETVGGAPERAVADVYFFGGSTMWGVGADDAGTIPSRFQQLAADRGLPVRAVNHGEDAYVQWQEILRLTELLAAGEVPDVVVVYDGVNDTFAYFQDSAWAPHGLVQQNRAARAAKLSGKPGVVRGLLNTSGVHRLFRAVNSLRPAKQRTFDFEWPTAKDGEPPLPTIEETADLMAERYLGGVEHLERLSRAYGFELVVAWQPSAFGRADYVSDEAAEAREAAGDELSEEERHVRAFGPALPSLYDAAYERIRPGFEAHAAFHDLSGLLVDEPGTVYIDWCHVAAPSNGIIAERLFELARPALDRASAGS